jgi:hypothetical protein
LLPCFCLLVLAVGIWDRRRRERLLKERRRKAILDRIHDSRSNS